MTRNFGKKQRTVFGSKGKSQGSCVFGRADESVSHSSDVDTLSRGLTIDSPNEFDFRRDILPSQMQPHNSDSTSIRSVSSTDSSLNERLDVKPLVRISNQKPVRRVQVLQQFEGVVSEVGDDRFVGTMHDLTNTDNEIEIMEFDLQEISQEDQEILQPGSVFYWTIGFETRVGGQIVRISEMRVQRNPIWTRAKLDVVESEAKRLFEKLNEDLSTKKK